MIKSHEQEVIKSETVIDNVVCNCCGKPIHKNKVCNNEDIYDDYLDISKAWGYFSNHDTEIHNCQICEDCCAKIANTFKIPIEIKYYM